MPFVKTESEGTIAEPLTLLEMCSTSRILPGHTVYLRGGTYSGTFVCEIEGTEANPIIIRPHQNERVIIDGELIINGDHTHWYEIEKCYSGGTRYTLIEGSTPPIVAGTLTVNGSGTWLVNWIIYDQVINGVGWWSSADGGMLYGCIIFNNGWLSTDRGHGHGVYTQNAPGNAMKIMKHCVLGPSFAGAYGSTNLTLYASGGDGCQHYQITESIMIRGTQLIGGGEVDDVTLDGCHIYGDALTLGYHDQGHFNAIVGNTCMALIDGSFNPLFMPRYTLQDCLVAHITQDTKPMIYSQEPATGVIAYTSARNAYHYRGTLPNPFQVETAGYFSFAEWQSRYSIDADSTYSTELPNANSVSVYPNEYKVGRGIIVIWNWTEADTVTVNVSAILAPGTSYNLHHALDYFGDITTGTVAGNGSINVDMRAISHTVAIPDGWDAPLFDSPLPVFGCFIINQTQ